MDFTKPSLSLKAQACLLIKRGMSGDRSLIASRLSSVSYYRLSGYWYPFRKSDDYFVDGTSIEVVWNRYVFDRHLRLLVMDAIERIEIAIRAQLSLHHSEQHGPFGYAIDADSLPKLKEDKRLEVLSKIKKETERSKNIFVKHFKEKYGDSHSDLPIWMATEIMSFGTVLSLFRGTSDSVQKKIAAPFGVPVKVFDSWLLTLNTTRNICAHHSRLWNRVFGTKPKFPNLKRYPEWHTPVKINNLRVFAVLTICQHCLKQIAPQTHWNERFFNLLEEYPNIPLSQMGFPDNWRDSLIWKVLADQDRQSRSGKPEGLA